MKDLKQILADSQKYWETNGVEGQIANLSDFDLQEQSLENANLTGANLQRANLINANLTGANLTDADLTGGTYLNCANLTNANLTNANLTDSTLDYANLSNANLFEANLSRAELFGVTLTGVSLSSAILKNATVGGGSVPIDPSVFGRTIDQELELRVANQILVPTALNMCEWHSCNTTHCLAGWAIHLAGDEGYLLEQKTSPSVAGAMLLPSATHLFYATVEKAIDWADAVIANNR